MESVTMAGVLYVPVDEEGEPYRWGTEEEVTVSVWGATGARRDVQSEDRAIRAVSSEELRGLLGAVGETSSTCPTTRAPTLT